VVPPEPVTSDPDPTPQPQWQASPRQLARDSAYVMSRSGRLPAAISVLEAWFKEHPTDTVVALDLARLLARSNEWRRSIEVYSALIELERTAEMLFERGQVALWSGDVERGEADLLESEALGPSAATERQLGDHYRWRGDNARSAMWYHRALRRAPDDSLAREALQLLDRAVDARLLLPGELAPGTSGSSVQGISDNAGYDLYIMRLGQAFGVPIGTSSALTVTGELRSASNTTPGGADGRLEALGGDLTLATRLGPSKLSAALGVLDHGDAGQVVRAGASIDGFMGSSRLRASIRRAPAYEILWAPRLLGVALAAREDAQSAVQGQASFAVPLGDHTELWAAGDHLRLSSDNTRVGVQAALRRRVAGPMSLTWAAGFMSFDRQVALYYSPARYLSQSIGAEWSQYREEGVSFALRFAPGYAWIREPAGTLDAAVDRDMSAFQLTGGLDLGYRRNGWDLLLSGGFGSGREGGYRSGNALLSIRRAW
jgi:tetratricopeptide (TPR) repeat protein